jgi:hypothetical protein
MYITMYIIHDRESRPSPYPLPTAMNLRRGEGT